MTYRVPVTTLIAAGLVAFPQSSVKTTTSEQPVPNVVSPGPPQNAAWDVLRQGVADGDAEHRKQAIAAVGSIGDVHEAVATVEKGLQDKDTQVRQTAAATLGQMGSKEAIPSLKAALDDKPEISFTAAKSLWDLGDDSARYIFQEVIEGERKDAPGKMHTAVQSAKQKLKPENLAFMGVTEATGAMFGPASYAIVAVREAIKDKKGDNAAPGRAAAAAVLSKDKDPYAITLLEWALGDSNWAVRVAAAKGVGERGNQDSIAKLVPLLSDDHHAVRYMAAASIIRLSGKPAAPSE